METLEYMHVDRRVRKGCPEHGRRCPLGQMCEFAQARELFISYGVRPPASPSWGRADSESGIAMCSTCSVRFPDEKCFACPKSSRVERHRRRLFSRRSRA